MLSHSACHFMMTGMSMSPSRHFYRTLDLRSHSSNSSEHHYARKAPKYWDNFYKRHNNKIGCGAGNTVFPLLDAFPTLFIHACDFSHNAISLVKSREDFREDQVNAFVCDITKDDICEWISPSSVDILTLIFTLSAVSPNKMPFVLHMLKKVLKPGGYVLFRDYAIGDFAQEKLVDKNQMISENFCVRGDGTCAFYFSEDYLSSLFRKEGFNTMEINTYCKEIVNRSRDIVMHRRWMRAVFCKQGPSDTQHFVLEA